MLYVITTIPCHKGIYDKKEGKKETVYRILDVAIIFFLFSSSTFYTVLMQSRRSVGLLLSFLCFIQMTLPVIEPMILEKKWRVRSFCQKLCASQNSMCILERTENSIYRSRSVKDENNTNHPIFLLDPPLYFNSS